MSHDGIVITGSRPPSALSSHRPSSANSKHQGYHTLARNSSVDESLFGSQYPSQLDKTVINFKAPWEYPKPAPPRNSFSAAPVKKVEPPRPNGPPLLWCPPPSETSRPQIRSKTKSNLKDSAYLWSTRDHFKHLKHTPTFVDETLFGSKLQEPSFEAPWNARKKGEKKKPRPYLWDPSVPSNKADTSTNGGLSQRPATALGLSKSRSKGGGQSNGTMPVWKP
ncbi:RBPJ-interacting and tubulin-associated protein 1-like [Physella acuta]|uniref:RBPJ-interacting and tubulin-associated protein 1-like n=1 Tax=Physella acuta TaxID=109671 RepID=UPI0027DD7C94|nr:RBPJ-interacting and tubulin-associated protein 1-like [Physella acuta]XP_059168817.1 RBPJ-interacting and tubulin-associated protein 1-like [Physella acuta]XP_059168818.1 RBPJ-interacting and tubulin-associated protein 1-like [Physella acuta]